MAGPGLSPLLEFQGGVIVPRLWRRIHKLAGERLAATVGPLAELGFANLVPGHGPAVAGGADQAVGRAVAAVVGSRPT